MRETAGVATPGEGFSCKEDGVGSNPTPGSRGTRAASVRTSAVRILIVTNAYPSAERPSFGIYIARLVAALERGGHEIVLVSSSELGGGRLRAPRKYARLAWRARAAAVRSRRDVIWGHYLVPTGTIARRAARGAGIPYALTAHGTDVANAERS